MRTTLGMASDTMHSVSSKVLKDTRNPGHQKPWQQSARNLKIVTASPKVSCPWWVSQPTVTCLTLILCCCIKIGFRNITFPPGCTDQRVNSFSQYPSKEALCHLFTTEMTHFRRAGHQHTHPAWLHSSSTFLQLFNDLLKLTHFHFCLSQRLLNNFF